MIFRHRLAPVQEALAANMATGRLCANNAGNVASRKVGGKLTEWQANYEGCKCEVAYGAIFNLCPDMTTHLRSRGYDFIHKGYRVDVKGTSLLDGNLIAQPHEIGKADIYAFATVDGVEVVVYGYAYAEELFAPSNVRPLYGGGPDTHFVPREALHEYTEDFLPKLKVAA